MSEAPLSSAPLDVPQPASEPSGRLAFLLACVLAVAYTLYMGIYAHQYMLGGIRDDGMYALAARAIAHGQGYIDLATPGHPLAMRYPPGFSLLLAATLPGAVGPAAEAARMQWVPPIAGGLILLASFGYARLRAGLSPWAALAVASLALISPYVTRSVYVVMAELPFSLACLLCVWAAETLLARKSDNAWAWLGVGALASAACLIRYAGLALYIAIPLVLLVARRWRALVAFVAGAAAVFMPWWLYQHLTPRWGYVSDFMGRFPKDRSLLYVSVVAALLGLFVTAIPSSIFGSIFLGSWYHPSPTVVTLGVMLSLVVLVGMVPRLWRPIDPARMVGVAFVLVSWAVATVYGIAFAFYAGEFLGRAEVPLVLFTVIFAMDGVGMLIAAWSQRARQVTLASLFVLCLLNSGWGSLGMLQAKPLLAAQNDELRQMFKLIADNMPDDVRLMSPFPHMTTFYAGREAVTMTESGGGVQLMPGPAPTGDTLHYIYVNRIDYVIGIPYYVIGSDSDLSVLELNALRKQAPGLLHQIYLGPRHDVVLYGVDKLALQLYANHQHPKKKA